MPIWESTVQRMGHTSVGGEWVYMSQAVLCADWSHSREVIRDAEGSTEKLLYMTGAQVSLLSAPNVEYGDSGLGVPLLLFRFLWSDLFFFAAFLITSSEREFLFCAHMYRKSVAYVLILYRLTIHRLSAISEQTLNLDFCKIYIRLVWEKILRIY